MAGMKFEYDENGGKFFYFLLSVYALVVIPCTYYMWPNDKKKSAKQVAHPEEISNFGPCRIKSQLLNAHEPRQKKTRFLIKIVIIAAWIIFAVLAYKVSQVKVETKEYDPYVILDIERGASEGEIRKKYRERSKTMHPDRGGDENQFKELVKAFKALTDNETRKNWEEYGNPDGPGVTHFGIALPKWMVDDKNSIFVLGVYVVIFMVIMPTVVGLWWYKSIKYTSDKIFIITAQMYWMFLNKSISMTSKRALMILGASFEFDRNHNPEMVDRVSDNVEIPHLLKELTEDIQIKNREQPLCWPHAVKARALIHAHLEKLDLPKDTLLKDKNYIIRRCPYLINEMVNILTQAVGFAHANGAQAPKLDTIECVMKLSPLIVQALTDKNKNSLLQLPHIEESNLKHFVGKKRNILNVRQFVATKDSDRRSILRNLTDEQYDDIMRVCEIMPFVRMTVKSQVLDDDDDNIITAGALVTLTVSLHRQNLRVLFDKEGIEETQQQQQQSVETPSETLVEAKEEKFTNTTKKPSKQQKEVKKNIEEGDDSLEYDSSDAEINGKNKSIAKSGDDDFIVKFQQQQKKRENLEAKEKISHRVYCPYFPDIKQECWWLYVCDRKHSQLISAPVYICTLKDTEELDIKFSAPKKPGVYSYSVVLRSDCYFDFDVVEQVKLDVKEAKKIEDYPELQVSDEEMGDEDDSNVKKDKDDEYVTDED